MTDSVSRMIGNWRPDMGDLPTVTEDEDKQDRTPRPPVIREKEKSGHIGLCRRGHGGHRK